MRVFCITHCFCSCSFVYEAPCVRFETWSSLDTPTHQNGHQPM